MSISPVVERIIIDDVAQEGALDLRVLEALPKDLLRV